MPTVGIGLTLWEGQFEEAVTQLWLRWCVYPSGGTASQRDGQLIPTGAEGRDIERQRADRLAERLQALGINPDEV